MKVFVHIACTAILMAGLAGCGGGGGSEGGAGIGAGIGLGGGVVTTPQTPAVPPQQGQGRVERATITSKKTGYTYPLEIFVPLSHATGEATYPTIYALDGDATFNAASRFNTFKTILEQGQTEAILIGIGGTARRQEDYNFPGARAYHEFLTLELIPFIESRYRADTTKRILSGLSTSGNLAATALFLEAPETLFFSHFISAEAAFWQQEGEVNALEQRMFDALAGRPLPVTLILARCATGGNSGEVNALYRRMARRGYQGLTLIETTFPEGHAAMDIPSFRDAIQKILH